MENMGKMYSEDFAHMDEAVFQKAAPGRENTPITESRRPVNKARVCTTTRKYPMTKI